MLAFAEFSQRVAEIILGLSPVERILLPRKAFECAVVETDGLAQCPVVAALFANRAERVAENHFGARNVLGSPVLRGGAFKQMAYAVDEGAEPVSDKVALLSIKGGALSDDQQTQDIRKDRSERPAEASDLRRARNGLTVSFGAEPSAVVQ